MTQKLIASGFAGTNITFARFTSGLFTALFICMAGVPSLAGGPVDVPSVSAGLGPCPADFTVVDATSKPIYNATIHLKMKYGFMSKRDTVLDVGTNSDGKARMEGLPDKLKKPPMEFTITKDTASQTVTADPATNCHATFAITLK